MNLKINKGFTLSEVLITLGIIGIVAALTIPTLINNYQKKRYVEGAKKGYSILTQALKMAAIENDTPENLAPIFSDWRTAPILIKNQMKILKDCDWTLGQGCWGDSAMESALSDHYRVITADGIGFSIGYSLNCAVDKGANADSPTKNVCGMALIDSNGPKPPNMIGRDIFEWFMTSSKKGIILYPTGGKEDNSWSTGYPVEEGEGYWNKGGRNGCTSADTGSWFWYCAGRLVEKGWVMDW